MPGIRLEVLGPNLPDLGDFLVEVVPGKEMGTLAITQQSFPIPCLRKDGHGDYLRTCKSHINTPDKEAN